MFKLLPIIVSLAIAGAGGVAVSNTNHFQETADTSAQIATQANIQSNVDAYLQNSSDFFLSAAGNSTINAGTNTQYSSDGAADANVNISTTSSLDIGL